MSTILDALKKSEQERKLQNLPTLSDMPVPKEPALWPKVLLLCVFVLLILISVYLFVDWRKSSQESTQKTNVLEFNNMAESNAVVEDAKQAIVVNVISYSENIEKRFAMINGQMYRENDFVRPGLQVEKITSSTVTLNERGQRIHKAP